MVNVSMPDNAIRSALFYKGKVLPSARIVRARPDAGTKEKIRYVALFIGEKYCPPSRGPAPCGLSVACSTDLLFLNPIYLIVVPRPVRARLRPLPLFAELIPHLFPRSRDAGIQRHSAGLCRPLGDLFLSRDAGARESAGPSHDFLCGAISGLSFSAAPSRKAFHDGLNGAGDLDVG
jgi:hypothetical protein